MDRLNQIKSETGGSRDLTLDTSSPPSESFMTANESSSKFYSLSDVDSTFDVSPTKGTVITTDTEPDQTISDTEFISKLSPIPKKADNYKIGKQIEAANILSGGVNIFDDNENSYDGDELVIDDNVIIDDDKPRSEVKIDEKSEGNVLESVDAAEAVQSKDSEVVLQIDGKHVDAIDIGNGLYLYRKAGEEELAAVQIVDDGQQQQSFKFLKVRENAEGNLEVYEEIEIEVPKEVPIKEGKPVEKNSYVPIKDISKVISEPSCNKDSDNINNALKKDLLSINENKSDINIESHSETKSEVNINGKMMKFNESRKSPIISTFTPMTYHSTPNKEGLGIPLTKTMVDQQLHPNRHSDNVKKTIEVNTESKQKLFDSPPKNKDLNESMFVEEEPFSNIDKLEVNAAESLTHSKELKTELNKCEMSKSDIQQTVCSTNVTSSEVVEKIESKKINMDCDEVITNIKKSSTELIEAEINKNNLEQIEPVKNNELDTSFVEKPSVEDKLAEGADKNEANPKQICKELNDNIISEKKVMSENNKIQNKPEIVNETIQPSINTKTNEIDHHKVIEIIDDEEVNHGNKLDNINILKNVQKEDSSPSNINTMSVGEREIITKGENTALTSKIVDTKDVVIEKPSRLVVNDTSKTKIINEIENQKSPMKNFDKIKMINVPICNTNESLSVDVHDQSKNEQSMALSIQEITTATSVSKKNNFTETSLNSKDTKSKADSWDKNKIKMNSINPIINVKDEDKGSIIQANLPTSASQSLKSGHKTENFKFKICESKSNINNNAAVPFGKWTEANRQEFLNKIKETKVPCSNTNTKQLKQPNDLNRRDVLKKIDSQRQSNQAITKNKELALNKLNLKTDSSTAFVNKLIPTQKLSLQETKSNKNIETSQKNKNTECKKTNDVVKKSAHENANVQCNLKSPNQRKEIINNQDLIDKTIEGIINRAVLLKPQDEIKQNDETEVENKDKSKSLAVSLDDIEKKMNELHGIPFIERPPHELPKIYNHDNKQEKDKTNKDNKKPELRNKDSKQVKENVIDDLSDEEIIEHQPITGDLGRNVQNAVSTLNSKDLQSDKNIKTDEPKKDAIITEKDFDKFVRRNSIPYENCLTVNFDGKETRNVIQTVVEKDVPIVKKLSRNELMLAESKAKSTHKHLPQRHNNHPSKIPTSTKPTSGNEESHNKNYQSKVQLAYQSAMTAKRQMECPITIIEDKPVKVVYMDTTTDFSSSHLDVQGQELSPPKRSNFDISDIHSASESIDSDIVLDVDHNKIQDESRTKSKHQRKQVLTPVDSPEIELIEPHDLGIEISIKKKRKIDDNFSKNLVPKKSYLLNRNTMDQKKEKILNISKNIVNEPSKCNETFVSAISAIDNLVKAAELLETQSENKSTSESIIKQTSEVPISTPVKRGRGRPRKYPLPEAETVTVKTPSPQKKPKLLPDKVTVDDEFDNSSDDEMIQENWTMGKINENIVCPICNKLFRSENVVFKHVKHCTGPSPNRSDSDRRSSRRFRQSQESERKSINSLSEDSDSEDDPIMSTKFSKTKDTETKPKDDKSDVILIEDTPKKRGTEEAKLHETKKTVVKNKEPSKVDNLTCEFCGKTFRQLSYLVNHKLQHRTEDTKKLQPSQTDTNKSVLSCEVCNKEFRQLHHLVQHRTMHNSNTVPSRLRRKSSIEQNEVKVHNEAKQTDDQSAGFRCEPCDKSFRKLHHLVEHRETHDGINKKSTSGTTSHVETVKTAPVHVCDVCKKTFKKLQQLLEHKEQHLDTCSEKSDDKSVKSSLSTRDIIHECSLCYMVFPNEHSLNKHTIICLRKKKQSANKQAKLAEEKAKQESEEKNVCDEDKNSINVEVIESKDQDEVSLQKQEIATICVPIEEKDKMVENVKKDSVELCVNKIDLAAKPQSDKAEVKSNIIDISHSKRSSIDEGEKKVRKSSSVDDNPIKMKTLEVITIPDTPTPKKKTPVKEKVAETLNKSQKSVNVTRHVISDAQSVVSSDDDEIRYMLNPNFKEDSNEGKVFMKVRANKRSSLQIERPDSKNLIKRRISLQHPPRLPRLKAKAVERRPSKQDVAVKPIAPIPEATPATDSDDSDVKYSFPENVSPKTAQKSREKKIKRQSLAAKRKSIGGIAKRKSLGKHKISSSTHIIRKRTTEADHRCDCGQLFSSAALLARHTTLAHTPPRIRRRRSPPPEPREPIQRPPQKPSQQQPNKPPQQPVNKQPHKQPHQPTHKPLAKRKTIADSPKSKTLVKKPKSDVSNRITGTGTASRKSSVNSEVRSSDSDKVVRSESNTKILRSAAHRGVPVPEKMRKFMELK